jgi:hypothetical protein
VQRRTRHVVETAGHSFPATTERENALFRKQEDCGAALIAYVERVGSVAKMTGEARWEANAAQQASRLMEDRLALAERLANFGACVSLQYHGGGERGDVDGGWLQEAALTCGVLERQERTTPCGERCACAEYHGSGERVTCHPIRNYADVNRRAISTGVLP